jgi:class 3 adenylate cyclase/tetratricopeptide (TPR) repeat protein
MTFEEILDQAIAMLQRRGRLTYGALKRQFQLDDAALDDLKEQLLYAHPQVADDAGRGLVWTDEPDVSPTTTPPTPTPASPGLPRAPQAVHPPQTAASPATSPPHEAERRQLTILFCDLVGSTALSAQLDPEDLREVVRAYQRTCAEVIQRFDGHIAQYLGDGLLVYFGYPQAHEDDAQRAVRTGMGMVEAIDTLNSRLGQWQSIRLAVRVGIHTGLVVVGEIGGGGRQEQLALGDTPNIAARLQGLAAPDTVVISAATARLVQGYFTWQELGAHAARGVPAPLQLYRVLQESGAQSRLDATMVRGLTPFVGRATEVTLLLERWRQVKDGLGQVILLSGAAGIGKSRLVQVLKGQVADESYRSIECRCLPYYQNSALYPVITHLERVLALRGEDAPLEKLHKLEGALAQYSLPLLKVVPLFAALLSIPLPEHYPPLTLTPQQQRQQTLEALLAWLLAEASQQPVLFIVEDLHWVDPSTVEFLSLVVDQGPTARLCSLFTFRPDFTPPWANRSHLTPMTLSRLPPCQAEAMITSLIGGKALPAAVVEQAVGKTDGVPLFVEELVKMILESGLVREEEDHYVLTGPLPPLAIPTTLHDALMARLDRLGQIKAVAQLGATIGRTFPYDLLYAVAPFEEVTLQSGLRQLVDAELLYQHGEPPQATYLFKHALIQEAAYQSLLRSTRQQHHQRIAQVLAERFPETAETQPEVVAQHYTAAGLHAQARPYWQRGGQRALERSAYREAVECFEQALSALPHLPETHTTREQAIDLRLALRAALLPSGDYGRILASLQEAETLATALDDPRRLGQISLFLSAHFRVMGAYDQAIAAAQRALTLTTASGEVVPHGLAHHYLGVATAVQGDYRRAIDCFGQALACFDAAPRRERVVGQLALPTVLCRAWLTVGHAELGLFAEGRARGEEGLRMAEAADHPASFVHASWGLGALCLRQGDLCRSLPLLERAMGLCQNVDDRSGFLSIAWVLGAAYTLAGRVADAVSLLTQAVEQGTALGHVGNQAQRLYLLGEAQVLAGRLEEGHALTERALALARAHQERGYQAWALYLLSEIAARREPPQVEPAAAHYRQALALAEELGRRPLQAHCHRSLGTLYAMTGHREQARTALSTAIALYRDMAMTFWLPQTEAALAQVKGR